LIDCACTANGKADRAAAAVSNTFILVFKCISLGQEEAEVGTPLSSCPN
jgi:hypothetical protein